MLTLLWTEATQAAHRLHCVSAGMALKILVSSLTLLWTEATQAAHRIHCEPAGMALKILVSSPTLLWTGEGTADNADSSAEPERQRIASHCVSASRTPLDSGLLSDSSVD